MSDPISDLKQELLAAADRRRGHAGVRAGRMRMRGHPGRTRLVLASATLLAAAALALLFTAPWNESPGFLERAQAALAPPAGTILHMKWGVTSTWPSPACTVTRGPNEIWIDQAPPHRYRAILDDPPIASALPETLACSSGTVREVGGTVDPACSSAEQPSCTTQETLKFVPPNTLSVSPLQFVLPPDPVTMLREAISAGSAHDEGETQLDGRTVERIRIDSESACAFPSCPPGYVYVDPETFHPVEMHSGGIVTLPDGTPAEVLVVDRYLTFEYLPRTAVNLALADIRAQHPDATVVDPPIPGDE
jgi:hypothetical protein